MTSPYDITQVDVPGALNALEAARSNRIRQMLLQRQLAQEERALEAQQGVRAAVNRYTGGGDLGAASAPAPATSTSPMGDAVSMYGGTPDATPAATPMAVPALPNAAAAPTAAPAAGHGDIGRLATELLAISPEQAAPIIQAFRQMDEATFTTSQRRNATLARAAYTLLAIPDPTARSVEFQRIAPDLMQNGGVTRQQLAGFELTTENLHHVINQARDVEKLAEEARPQLRNVGPGDVLIDERNPTGGPLYESPYIRGADGTVYERGPASGAPSASAGQPRGLRNNNPGNIEDGPFARAQPGYQGSDGRFARYATSEQGIRAQETLLRSNYLQRPTTVRAVIERYSPRSENGASTDNYIRYVEQRLGIAAGGTIDATRGRELAEAMREFETGQRGPTRTAQNDAAVEVRTPAEARQLPPGTTFRTPDGRTMRR